MCMLSVSLLKQQGKKSMSIGNQKGHVPVLGSPQGHVNNIEVLDTKNIRKHISLRQC